MRSVTRNSVCLLALAVTLATGGSRSSYAADPPADNTGKNVRDREGAAPTPMDQSEGSDADLKRTQDIRKAVVDDDALSVNAHNVKIVTLDGVTTLRGPVKSAAEKTRVGEIATRVAGNSSKIKNELEVAP